MNEQTNPIANMSKVRGTVVLGDDTRVDIYACRVKHISTLLGIVREVLQDLNVTDLAGAMAGVDEIKHSMDNPQTFLQLISKSAVHLSTVGAIVSSVGEVEFDDLEIDDAIKILLKGWEVNQDFFTNRIKPLLGPMLSSLDEKTEEQKTKEQTTAP